MSRRINGAKIGQFSTKTTQNFAILVAGATLRFQRETFETKRQRDRVRCKETDKIIDLERHYIRS